MWKWTCDLLALWRLWDCQDFTLARVWDYLTPNMVRERLVIIVLDSNCGILFALGQTGSLFLSQLSVNLNLICVWLQLLYLTFIEQLHILVTQHHNVRCSNSHRLVSRPSGSLVYYVHLFQTMECIVLLCNIMSLSNCMIYVHCLNWVLVVIMFTHTLYIRCTVHLSYVHFFWHLNIMIMRILIFDSSFWELQMKVFIKLVL